VVVKLEFDFPYVSGLRIVNIPRNEDQLFILLRVMEKYRIARQPLCYELDFPSCASV